MRAVVELVNLASGCFAWRNDTGMRPTMGRSTKLRMVPYGTPGAPDIFAVVDGRLVGLEVKTGSGRLEGAQPAFHERLRRAGATVAVVRSLEDAADAIRHPELLYGRKPKEGA